MSAKRPYAITLVAIGIFMVPALNAQQNWASSEEFRTEYLRFVDSLSAHIPATDESSWAVGLRQKIADVRQQVVGLSPQNLQYLSKASNREEFVAMVNKLSATNDKFDTRESRASSRVQRSSTAGSVKVRPQGVISPPDFSGFVAGSTCSSSYTSISTLDGEKIGLYVDRGLGVPLDYACETIVEILGEGTNAIPCVAAAVAKAVEVVLDSLIDHQEFCNGFLDAAVADATLKDAEDIHDDLDALDVHLTNVNNQITSEFTALDTHVTNVDNHIAAEFVALDSHMVLLFNQLSTQLTNATDLMSADMKQVMKLELTPEGQRQIVPAILTCTGPNCPNVLTKCTGSGGICSWNNVGPLP